MSHKVTIAYLWISHRSFGASDGPHENRDERTVNFRIADDSEVDGDEPFFVPDLSFFLTRAENAHMARSLMAEPMELALGLPLHSAWQVLYTEPYGSV